FAAGVESQPQEVSDGHAWYLDRVLESQVQPCPCPLVRLELEDALAFEQDVTASDRVAGVARDYLGESRLARPVRPHQRMDLTSRNRQVYAPKYRVSALDLGV